MDAASRIHNFNRHFARRECGNREIWLRHNANTRIVLRATDEQNAPRRRTEVNRTETAIARLHPLRLVDVTDEHHRATVLLCHRRDALHDRTDLVGAVHIHVAAEVRLHWIEYDEPSAGFVDRLLQPLVQHREFLPALVDNEHAGAVRAHRFEPRLDRVGESVLRRLVDDSHRRLRYVTARQRFAARERRDDREDERGLALAGIALHDGELAERNVGRPQLFHLLRPHVAHLNELEFVCHFFSSSLGKR